MGGGGGGCNNKGQFNACTIKKKTQRVYKSATTRAKQKTNKESPAMHEAILTSEGGEGGGGGGGCSHGRTNEQQHT